jgi:hypothetical protein
MEKPSETYLDIGGLDIQKQEVREAVELPLTHFELYRQIGIDPPRGVLMYGPPGTGKTMMAKAVANATTAAFISMVGSEFVQKYLGEGPRMVRDVFRLAKENCPAIVFIDEIDAIATKRFDAQTGADREVQRILLELLNQMDGFDQSTNVKVRAVQSGWLTQMLITYVCLIMSVCLSGDHGYQSRRHSGPRAAAARPPGPQDRVPAPGPPPEAPRVHRMHLQDEPQRRGEWQSVSPYVSQSVSVSILLGSAPLVCFV